jgi:hypothetical protein
LSTNDSLACATAQIFPVEPREKPLAPQKSAALSLEMNAKLYAQLLLGRNRLAQVPHARFATCCERFALSGREASQVFKNLLHRLILLHGNNKANTLQCFTWR